MGSVEEQGSRQGRLDDLLVKLGGRVEVGGQLLESSTIRTFLRTDDRTLVLTDLSGT
jgi:hypothetical protein